MKSALAAFIVAGAGLAAGIGAPGPTAVPERQQTRWPAPRKQAPVSLRLLWRSDQVKNDASALLYPSDIQFSATGLLVFDYGEMKIVGLNSANGRGYFSSGRRGAGPGEFNGPVWFFGTYAKPMAVQFSSSRVTSVSSKGELSGVPVSRSGRWTTGCSWGDGTLLFQASGFGEHDYFVSTTGPQAATVDSLSHPWERLRNMPFLARQAGVNQVDDSTCALLPGYNVEFALISPGKPPITGVGIEDLPPVRVIITHGKSSRGQSFERGAIPGASDAALWRDYLMILFRGQTEFKQRILDVFDRSSMEYRGSVLLPFETTRMATRGDTLAVVGESDLEPVVAVFLLNEASR